MVDARIIAKDTEEPLSRNQSWVHGREALEADRAWLASRCDHADAVDFQVTPARSGASK